jgi:hypothetical protein
MGPRLKTAQVCKMTGKTERMLLYGLSKAGRKPRKDASGHFTWNLSDIVSAWVANSNDRRRLKRTGKSAGSR